MSEKTDKNPENITQLGTPIRLRADGSMSIKDAAAVIGITPQAIRKWLARGCPYRAGGGGQGAGMDTVKIADVIRWKEDEAVTGLIGDGQPYDEGTAKAADWHFRAILRQAAARKELGSLVAVDAIADVIEEDYERTRSRLNSIPSRVNVKLAAEDDPVIVRHVIQEEIRKAMGNLSTSESVIRRAGGDPSTSVHDPLPLEEVDLEDDEEDDVDDD
ncbi:hypothetical protein [Sulfitobacter guttiformis]|uniref:Phage terminase Nu1 subunit (DNA packaging protein) n=1 Tax=Sulfitobacter guttiformis TaxID=74349 RepID=A0A420DHB8_9RHOB|nr:hypothetical protein [Sulfitobacter guttiformis]KIN72657.1 hypothetical protein Z949_1835 [Sulfitobacter guttiformis KCTC 32187]RKE93613.1 hypothetical protein C8N30_2690 [Sulfitobacter guttiformis]